MIEMIDVLIYHYSVVWLFVLNIWYFLTFNLNLKIMNWNIKSISADWVTHGKKFELIFCKLSNEIAIKFSRCHWTKLMRFQNWNFLTIYCNKCNETVTFVRTHSFKVYICFWISWTLLRRLHPVFFDTWADIMNWIIIYYE